MAMHSGLASSKVLILVGAGLTGSIILRGGHLSDIIFELQALIKGLNEATVSPHGFDQSAFLAAQVRRLAQEVRELTLSRPVTIINGDSASQGNLASYIMPAAALGALGYCYMWWKGLSLSDFMYVTKRNMANAVANVSKQLEQVSAALAYTKRHLTQRLQNLDGKMDEQMEMSKLIKNEVDDVKSDLSQIGMDIEIIQRMVSGLEGKIELLEDKQDIANAGVWYLCQFAGGMKDMRIAELFQNFTAKKELDQSVPIFSGEQQLKGLQFIAETVESGTVEKSKMSTTLQNDFSDPQKKTNVFTRTKIHRSGLSGFSFMMENQVS
ncbi:hypothetical protein AMTRI_Chr10g229370 [Amborella trichopoda]|uniref:DUF1664 domain-containing protein n=1 Tax=Amborella trichopoda TaxID=13333 RepID=W1P182_AMBTC|nr:uncharacterized protein LOC18429748 isoform X2 [Amborella trichopoda]ERN01663.1 hypothetical protein AMTR_s00090p00126740 [Amborella trichopoda]|eukprot:XP_006839094.1 uncharacterized protein LOC18429748 isoform X2 [Amborella trichopoda]